jgi:hypothetical protein
MAKREDHMARDCTARLKESDVNLEIHVAVRRWIEEETKGTIFADHAPKPGKPGSISVGFEDHSVMRAWTGPMISEKEDRSSFRNNRVGSFVGVYPHNNNF